MSRPVFESFVLRVAIVSLVLHIIFTLEFAAASLSRKFCLSALDLVRAQFRLRVEIPATGVAAKFIRVRTCRGSRFARAACSLTPRHCCAGC
jgi:hypothetical protein